MCLGKYDLLSYALPGRVELLFFFFLSPPLKLYTCSSHEMCFVISWYADKHSSTPKFTSEKKSNLADWNWDSVWLPNYLHFPKISIKGVKILKYANSYLMFVGLQTF